MENKISPAIEASLNRLAPVAKKYPVQSFNFKKLTNFLASVELSIFIDDRYSFCHASIGPHKGIALTFEKNDDPEDATQYEFVFDKNNEIPHIFSTSTLDEVERFMRIDFDHPRTPLAQKLENSPELVSAN